MDTHVRFLLVDVIRTQDILEESLGLASLSAVLRKDGHTVQILKCREEDIPYEKMEEFKPDIVGFTSGSYNIKQVLAACSEVKRRIPSAIVCIGGYSPTFYYQEILESNQDVDFLMRGEGELTIAEVAQKVAAKESFYGIPGTVYRSQSGEIIVAPEREQIADMDSLPLPERDILKQHKLNIAPLESSRGCLGRCSFCSFKQFWVGTSDEGAVCFREKTPERVIEEICQVVRETGVKRITFVDGSFDLSPRYKREKLRIIAQGIIDNGLNISYYFSARINFYRQIGEEVLQLMIKSGFCGVFLGVESFYKPDLALFQKGVSVDDNIKALEYCETLPINVDIGLINFHPFSTFEGMRVNAKYVHRFKYAARFFLIEPLILFRGTKIYDDCKAQGLILKEDIVSVSKYSYADPRVGTLIRNINRYFRGVIDNEHKYTVEISDYFNDHLDVICGIKRYFENLDKPEELNLITEYLDQLQTNQNIMNDLNTDWFLQLLDIAESGCEDEKEYERILRENIPLERVKEMAKQLGTNKFNLFIKLQRMNRDYRNLF